MATLKEQIVSILQTDAQLTAAGKLGNTSLLGRSAVAPYGIYYQHPPDTVDLADGSYVSYFQSAQSGRKPRDLFFNFTAWGNNFEAIQSRIYDLLNDATIVSTDFRTLMIRWNFANPELFDDDIKAYFQQVRYWVKGWTL